MYSVVAIIPPRYATPCIHVCIALYDFCVGLRRHIANFHARIFALSPAAARRFSSCLPARFPKFPSASRPPHGTLNLAPLQQCGCTPRSRAIVWHCNYLCTYPQTLQDGCCRSPHGFSWSRFIRRRPWRRRRWRGRRLQCRAGSMGTRPRPAGGGPCAVRGGGAQATRGGCCGGGGAPRAGGTHSS